MSEINSQIKTNLVLAERKKKGFGDMEKHEPHNLRIFRIRSKLSLKHFFKFMIESNEKAIFGKNRSNKKAISLFKIA